MTWAERLAFAILGIGVPVLMVFSNRSSAALLVVAAALVGFADLAVTHRFEPIGPLPQDPGRLIGERPILALLVVFFVFAAASLVGTASPGFHGWRLLEFSAPVLATGAMLSVVRRRGLPLSALVMVAGLIVASGLILIDIKGVLSVRGILGLRDEDYRLNRPAVTLAMLLVPALAVCFLERRPLLAIAAIMTAGLAILSSASGAAILGFLVATSVLMLAAQWPRASFALVRAGALLTMATAPWHGIVLADAMPHWLHEQLRSTSSFIRTEIYRAFGWAVEANPFFGSGFNTASRFDQEPAYQAIPAKLQGFIEFGHAHNAALQIWVEFGLAGAVLTLALILLAFRAITRAPGVLRPFLLASFASTFMIALISHGAWQAWWAGCIGVTIVLFAAIARRVPAKS